MGSWARELKKFCIPVQIGDRDSKSPNSGSNKEGTTNLSDADEKLALDPSGVSDLFGLHRIPSTLLEQRVLRELYFLSKAS
ncbi:hypothetical protein VNO77_08633 [Canavalia gladiata]|uniref:Uncharacterized protein n=1 Tax=Canavalia gladiata TaxID=3824 RepID=A0AAN9MA71_CANGL